MLSKRLATKLSICDALTLRTMCFRIKNNQLFFTTLYPGLTIKCRTLTDGSDWSICLNGQPVTGDSLQLYATDNSRKSKVVELGNQAQTPRLSVNDTIALFKRALNT